MDTTLILFSGLPGSGKTTLARRLAEMLKVPLLAKDRIQRVLRDHAANASVEDGYHFLLDLAAEQMALGVSVILDAVFPMQGFRTDAHNIAARHSAQFRAIHCYCSDETTWRARVEQRVQYVSGWTPVGWAEVERLRDIYHPWQQADALFVDALNPAEQNLSQIMAYLRGEHRG